MYNKVQRAKVLLLVSCHLLPLMSMPQIQNAGGLPQIQSFLIDLTPFLEEPSYNHSTLRFTVSVYKTVEEVA